MRLISPQGRVEKAPGEVVHVETFEGVPLRVVWRGRTFAVRGIEAIWCVEGRWWLDALRHGARRRCFRLLLKSQNSSFVCVEVWKQGAIWRLRGVWD